MSDTNTLLLLHLNEDVNDSSNNRYSISSQNLTFSSGGPFSGIQKADFNGTSSNITIPDSSDWYFDAGPFTIDFWFYFTAVPNYNFLVDFRQDDSNYFNIRHRNDGYWPGLWVDMTVAGSKMLYMWDKTHGRLNIGQWYHFALVRENNTSDVKTFLNGYQTVFNTYAGNRVITDFPDYEANIVLGAETGTGNSTLNGSLSEFRISNVVRWSEDFEVPTEPYGPEYYLSGNTSEECRMLVINEANWSIEKNLVTPAGPYTIETISGSKTLIARKLDGEAFGYSGILPANN